MKRQTEPSSLPEDPFQLRIQEEVEEFLQDLTLEYPFQQIFESLRRYEFKGRYGSKVVPLPKSKKHSQTKNIDQRISKFLVRLEQDFGSKYSDFIQDSFRYYSETTWE